MDPITITLDFQQLAVVVTANLMLKNPYDLNIAGEAPHFRITVADDDMGLELIHSVQDILVCVGFEKDYAANPLGDVCEDLIDIFGKYGFF